MRADDRARAKPLDRVRFYLSRYPWYVFGIHSEVDRSIISLSLEQKRGFASSRRRCLFGSHLAGLADGESASNEKPFRQPGHRDALPRR